jgi:hypothetical protein
VGLLVPTRQFDSDDDDDLAIYRPGQEPEPRHNPYGPTNSSLPSSVARRVLTLAIRIKDAARVAERVLGRRRAVGTTARRRPRTRSATRAASLIRMARVRTRRATEEDAELVGPYGLCLGSGSCPGL